MVVLVIPVDKGLSDFDVCLYDQVIYDHRPAEGLFRRISRCSLTALAGLFGYGCCYSYVAASLNYPQALLGYLSAIGNVIANGTFSTYNLKKFIEAMLLKQSPEEQRLSERYTPMLFRIANVSLPLLVGLFAGFPVVEVAMAFSKEKIWGILGAVFSLIGAGGPTVYFMYRGAIACESVILRRIHNFGQPKGVLHNTYKDYLLMQLDEKLHYGLTLTREERREKFSSLYLANSTDSEWEQIAEIKLLAAQLFEPLPPTSNAAIKASKWVTIPSALLRVAGAVMSISFLLETGLLARDAAKDFTQVDGVVTACIVASLIPWLWGAVRIPGGSLVNLYQQFTDFFGFSRQKTFVEERYFWIDKLVSCVSLCISVMPYAEMVEIAQQYYNWELWTGKALTVSTVLTIVLLFYHAVHTFCSELIEQGCERFGRDIEIREALAFKQRLLHFIAILGQLHPMDLKRWLSNYGDQPFVKEMITACHPSAGLESQLLLNS